MDEKSRLKLLDGMVWMYAHVGLAAAASKAYLTLSFFENKHQFANNPANTFLYMTLEGAVERAIIAVYENLREDEDRNGKLEFKVRGVDRLRLHRLNYAHPATYEWRDKEMRAFVEEEIHRADNDISSLWQARESIIERLAILGVTDRPANAVVPLSGSAEIIELVLRQTVRSDVQLPAKLKNEIARFFKIYEQEIKK